MDKPEYVMVPTQKTFIFEKGQSQESIDQAINEWLEQHTIEFKQGPMIGKTFANHATGAVYYVYMFGRKVEIPQTDNTVN